MSENGHRSLDLTAFTENAHITVGAIEFDLPLDMTLQVQGRIQRLVGRIGVEGVGKEEYQRLEKEVWALADEILEGATPHPGVSARELFKTKPAVFQLMGFLESGYRLLVDSSTTPSLSPTPTTAPSNSKTSSRARRS